MDRRIHNAIKLSAAMFLLNACGFAAKNKTSKDNPNQDQATPQLAVGATGSECYGLQGSQTGVTGVDESGDLFAYGNPQAHVLRTNQQVGQQNSQLVVSKGSCF
jgi:hypothetical protein